MEVSVAKKKYIYTLIKHHNLFLHLNLKVETKMSSGILLTAVWHTVVTPFSWQKPPNMWVPHRTRPESEFNVNVSWRVKGPYFTGTHQSLPRALRDTAGSVTHPASFLSRDHVHRAEKGAAGGEVMWVSTERWVFRHEHQRNEPSSVGTRCRLGLFQCTYWKLNMITERYDLFIFKWCFLPSSATSGSGRAI